MKTVMLVQARTTSRRLPGKVLIKSGAEGVHCGAFPALGLGFALKIDDGGKRAARHAG